MKHLWIIPSDINFGKTKIGDGKKALVEFVSANPTGPLTVAHGRGAIIGDTISRILEWNGYQVDREYYFNNAGRQMRVPRLCDNQPLGICASAYGRKKRAIIQPVSRLVKPRSVRMELSATEMELRQI